MKYIDLQYFPNITYFITLLKEQNPILTTHLPLQKGWFSNKCSVLSSTGPLNLSIPLLGGRGQKEILKNVKIAYTQNWKHQHIKAIETCYRNSPYYPFYENHIKNIIYVEHENLFYFNFNCLSQLLKILKLEINFEFSDEKIDESQIINSKKYFKEKSTDFEHNYSYVQVFDDRLGFTKNLSIIDLIFCLGPQSKEFLTKQLKN